MASKGKQRTSAVTAPEPHPVQAKPLWENNEIQFARLLCEIVATQDVDIALLMESMDLEVGDVNALFERAHVAWETAKGNR